MTAEHRLFPLLKKLAFPNEILIKDKSIAIYTMSFYGYIQRCCLPLQSPLASKKSYLLAKNTHLEMMNWY